MASRPDAQLLDVTLDVEPAPEPSGEEFIRDFLDVMRGWGHRPWADPRATYSYRGRTYRCGGVTPPSPAEAAAAAAAAAALRGHRRGEEI